MDLPPPALVCPVQPDAPATVDAARAARLAGEHDRARCLLDRILIEQPRSADAWVELGFLNAVSGQEGEAREAFLRALALAPEYDDAKLGLASLAYRAGDLAAAREWLARVSTVRAGDPEFAALHRALDAPDRPQTSWRWDAYAAYSTLSNDLAPWREASLSVSRRSGRASVGLAIERLQRFGLEDTFGEVRFSRQFAAGSWAVAAGGASEADFRPEAALRIEYATREDARTSFDAGLTVARYAVGQVDRLSLRARRRIAEPLRLDLLGVVVRDEADAVRTGYGVAAAWQAHRSLVIDASWVDAPESSEGVTLDVRSAALGATITLAENLRARVDIMREEREAFDRTEFSIGLARSF